MFKPVELLYEHCKENNSTIQEMHDKFLNVLEKTSEIEKWKYIAANFVEEHLGNMNQSMETDLKTDIPYIYDERWKVIVRFVRLYTEVSKDLDMVYWTKLKDDTVKKYRRFFIKDWLSNRTTENIGTLIIRSLDMPDCPTSFLISNEVKCKTAKDYLKNLNRIFTIPGQNMSLLDIAYLYSSMDYEAAQGDLNHLVNLGSYDECISSVVEELNDKFLIFDIPLAFQQFESKVDSTSPLPCMEHDRFPKCMEYCAWHKNLLDGWNKEEFLTTMRYALPQRKIYLNSINPYEKQIAGKLFGFKNIRDLKNQIAPVAMPIFCYEKYIGFLGDDIGMSAKVCNDFFPTPSDIGICLTRNLDINEIIHRREHNPIFEADIPRNNKKISGRPLQNEITLAIFTDADNGLSQTFDRKSILSGKRYIKFQLHQSKEFAQIQGDLDELTTSLYLETNHEYFIDVIPTGQISEMGFKYLNRKQRQCLLNDEVIESSKFKIYSENNCKYECYIALAKEACKCIPWDFLGNELSVECDIFGRTCFFKTMEKLTQSQINPCSHCLKECDYMKYHKFIKSKEKLWDVSNTIPLRKHMKFIDGIFYGDKFILDFLQDINGSVIDKGLKNFWNEIVSKKKYKYEKFRFQFSTNEDGNIESFGNDVYSDLIIVHIRFMKPKVYSIDSKYSLLDKFANFGGNFGIFAEITGCSFLAIVNLCILFFKILFSSKKSK